MYQKFSNPALKRSMIIGTYTHMAAPSLLVSTRMRFLLSQKVWVYWSKFARRENNAFGTKFLLLKKGLGTRCFFVGFLWVLMGWVDWSTWVWDISGSQGEKCVTCSFSQIPTLLQGNGCKIPILLQWVLGFCFV